MTDDLFEAVAYRVATGRPLKLEQREDGSLWLRPYHSEEELEESKRAADELYARLFGDVG